MTVKLGLTGSFGSGKSTVSAMFGQMGAAVIDADALARRVLEPGQPALAEVVAAFGPELLDGAGRLRRKALAERVFGNPAAVARLEAIVHPRVFAEQRRQLAALAEWPVVVLDVPLLFEVGADALADRVVVVTIAENQRFLRLRGRGFNEREIIARLGRQMAQARKIERADWVINNSGTLEQTREQVQSVMDALTKEKSQKDKEERDHE